MRKSRIVWKCQIFVVILWLWMRGCNFSCLSVSIYSRDYCVSAYVCYCICITVLYTCHRALTLSHPSWARWRVKWRMKVSALYLITLWAEVPGTPSFESTCRPCSPESSTPCVVCSLDLPHDVAPYKVASTFTLVPDIEALDYFIVKTSPRLCSQRYCWL